MLIGLIVLNQNRWIQLFILGQTLKSRTFFKTRAQSDAVAAALGMALLFLGLHFFVGFEFLYTYTRAHEEWEIDELILVCLSAPLPLAWYSYRRSKEVAGLAEKTLQIERELNHARKIESLGALAGGIAHELNNQLQPSQSITELMLEKRDHDEPDRKKLEMILSSVLRAKNTVSKILLYAHREQNSEQTCNVKDTLSDLDAFLRLSCPSFIHYELRCDTSNGSVKLSASELENIVVNLFTNAIHAVDQKPGEITIEAETANNPDHSEPQALIRITDNGCGISAELRERVFDPFVTTKDVGKGTGLGLWQVHNLVHRAGGKVKIESTPPTGTAVTLCFPLSI